MNIYKINRNDYDSLTNIFFGQAGISNIYMYQFNSDNKIKFTLLTLTTAEQILQTTN